jgi:hypothetical protein
VNNEQAYTTKEVLRKGPSLPDLGPEYDDVKTPAYGVGTAFTTELNVRVVSINVGFDGRSTVKYELGIPGIGFQTFTLPIVLGLELRQKILDVIIPVIQQKHV